MTALVTTIDPRPPGAARRIAAEAAPEHLSSSQRAASRRRSTLASIGAAISVVAVYLWDDALFAAPIVATTRWLGVLPAFLTLSVLYSAVSFALSLVAVRVYERHSGAHPSRFANWLEHQGGNRRSSWIRHLLLSGKVVGFVLSSFMLGGVVTVFLIRYSGRTDRLVRLAAVSSVLFGVTFVGFYSGLGRIAFGH